MVHIFTFCDKTLVGKKENKSANLLCEHLFKLNYIIDECSILPISYNFENLIFKNKDVYFFLMQRTSEKLNSFLSNLMGVKLIENSSLKQVVTDEFIRNNLPLDKDSAIEWTIPENVAPITNPNGKTQGYIANIGDTTVFVLPNNFYEFFTIFNDCLLSYIEDNFKLEYKSETFKTFGLSEELLYKAIKDQIRNKDKISVSIFSKGLDNDIVIKAKHNNEKFDNYRQIIFNKLENYIYAVQPISLDKYLEKTITDTNPKICVVGDYSVISITKNFTPLHLLNNFASVICLTNVNAKIEYGLSKKTIEEFGENSAEAVYELAVQCLNKNKQSELVLSSVCSFENNCVTAYIALGNNQKIDIYKNVFYGNEIDVLSNVAQTAKFYLIKKLKSRDYKTI